MSLEDPQRDRQAGGAGLEDGPASPCVNLCDVDYASGECLGCGRTLDEIGAWPTASHAERQAVLDRLANEENPTDG